MIDIARLDATAIERYNAKARPEYRLHPELGPSQYEGDIDTARLVMLLSNPGFDATSTPDDHTFKRNGWPLAALHDDAPTETRDWIRRRLRALTDIFGRQHVSQTVACLQLNPWASPKWDADCVLPSRNIQLELADRAAQRGAVILIMRSERLWLRAPSVLNSPRRYRVNSWRSSYVSPTNMSAEAWSTICNAVADHRMR